ncbi:anaphase-promoting complex, cyclosome, subunit 4-domain-containing protein [Diplogelasinospora grovesii]|uniref:Coatomer subunit delta n=1 Tax=Diplogelasinospora grovesii TaxID=303347 RepID=A0AAN6N671_9PEZI|nr:anaphase-promoting complex, cyclosome, subunit 4-domain-containing protein [Diplogelasinospora grovesii]
MVVLAASICTRGGKAVLARAFHDIKRSRIEALLASFPKAADSGTQHTTVEQDNVRFVYQPLDELYMVLITNKQSNILQDIDSLHLFAQVVTSTCKTLDEREILRNAYELLSAFDELVTLGYRENLTISQIKTFLEMESHEERIQEIIARNKELEATEERKRKAKQLEMQRKESARRPGGGMPRTPVYPTYTPPVRPAVTESYDSYEAEKNKSKFAAPKGKGMQLGKKSKTTDMFERVRGEMGAEVDDAPLVPVAAPAAAPEPAAASRATTGDHDAIHVTVNEAISAKLSREGTLNSFTVSGDLSLRISNPAFTKARLELSATPSHGAQFRTHPNVDRNVFNSSKAIQMANTAKGFPVNNSVGVLRWRATPRTDDTSAVPITFTVWVNKGSDGNVGMTIEYELTGGDDLKDVSVIIPYSSAEPTVSSFDAVYEVSGDSLEWTIGNVTQDLPSGAFEFEAQTDDENDFFPMQVRFSKTTPFVDVDVISAALIEGGEVGENVSFSKEIKSVADTYMIEYSQGFHTSLRALPVTEMAPEELQLFSQSTVSSPVAGGHIACNPVIDLTATVGDGGNVLYIWRANDQMVSKHTERNQKVEAIRWKEDGQFLAAGWSDGVVRLIGLENSKAVHHIRVVGDGAGNKGSPPSKIEMIAWSRNVTITKRVGRRTSLKKRLPLPSDISADDMPNILDLPRELTFLDVENSMPKISPLPVSGGSGDDMFVFSTTSSLEFVFRPFKPEDADLVDVMIVGTADGGIHLSIYDSLVIGTFRYPPPQTTARPTTPAKATDTKSSAGSFHLCGHGSHPDISTHALLLRPTDGNGDSLRLVPMDLMFINTSAVSLSLLASKTTTLQNLLRYVKQTQFHMAGEWKAARELPSRFLSAVREDLKNHPRGSLTIVQALYHTVVTGHVMEPVKEWLVDIVGERGHKRWDKAVVSSLQNLRALVHENFLPALERCVVILSRLLGIVRFYDTRENFGFTAAQITRLIDIVSCLTVVGHRILRTIIDELDYFAVFSTWFRLEIDRQSSPSTANDELTEKEATLDHAMVLEYLSTYLTSSPLDMHFDEVTQEDYTKERKLVEDGPGTSSLLELLKKQLEKQEEGQSYMKALPHVEFLVTYLNSRASGVFQGIAEDKRRNVRFGPPTTLSIGRKIWKSDLKVCATPPKGKTETDAIVYTALAGEDKRKVYLFKTQTGVINGVSTTVHTAACGIRLGEEGLGMVDFKFLDEESLLILCTKQKQGQGQGQGTMLLLLLRIPFQQIQYEEYQEGLGEEIKEMKVEDVGKGFAFADLPTGAGNFRPVVQMEVQDRNDRRGEIPGRVCLLGRDKSTYRTYALPEDWEQEVDESSEMN